jgi:hypothetical protein
MKEELRDEIFELAICDFERNLGIIKANLRI